MGHKGLSRGSSEIMSPGLLGPCEDIMLDESKRL